MRKLTTEEFIIKARTIHGDKYDYSKVDYKNSWTKVCIICPIHGEFWQKPNNHLNGYGCKKCRGLNFRNKYQLKVDVFIAKARLIHGDKYDYSKVEYINNHTKVCIICPIHGEYFITPTNHLKGHGCPKCGYTKRAIQKTKDFERFVSDSRIVHGDKYTYVRETYKDTHTKTQIICPKHGAFEQTPHMHLAGQGCPSCKESHGEREIARWLDEHNIGYKRQYKVIPEQVLFGRNTFVVDFFISSLNTIIEFHGEQHYKLCTRFHKTEEQFAIQQDRDRRLREHCKQNKIRLIEIPYTEIDNIDKILSKNII